MKACDTLTIFLPTGIPGYPPDIPSTHPRALFPLGGASSSPFGWEGRDRIQPPGSSARPRLRYDQLAKPPVVSSDFSRSFKAQMARRCKKWILSDRTSIFWKQFFEPFTSSILNVKGVTILELWSWFQTVSRLFGCLLQEFDPPPNSRYRILGHSQNYETKRVVDDSTYLNPSFHDDLVVRSL